MKHLVLTFFIGLLMLGLALPLAYAEQSINQPVAVNDQTAWSFVNSGQQLTIGKTNSVVLADLNGNGNLDILESNDFQNRRWTNNGDGSFLFLPSNYGAGGNESALADLNGDGLLDFFVARKRVLTSDTGENEVWLAVNNNSFITFQNSGQKLGNTDSRGVALADLNGDGFVDAFVANASYRGEPPTSNGNTVWFNDGNGNFSDSGQLLGISDSEAVALADLNGDGFVDAAVANGGSNNRISKVWFNDGSGNFSDSGQDLGTDWSLNVAIGDVNGDGHPDLVFGKLSGNVQLWLNNGSGVFSSGQTFADGQSVALGDLDGDDDLDLVIGKLAGVGSNQVWENDGAGNFTNSGLSLGSEVVYDIALGDVDRDGDLDILFAGNGTDEVLWFNNTPQFFEVVATIYLPMIIK
ncbi:MAG: VCBS repeat-containing protein [Ardenticatenaceae bacterium]|nr:VCBS repeat-containing protein [Ardenticatenaceae bacterium]